MEWQQKVSFYYLSNNKIKILSYICLLTYLLFSFINSSALAGTIYTCKDKDGNTIYTDSSEQKGGCATMPESKQIKPLPSFQAPTRSNAVDTLSNILSSSSDEEDYDEQDSDNTYDTVNIVSPQSGETINRCNGILDISFSTSPALYLNDSADLYMDGSKVASTTSNSFSLSAVDRGNHSIMIKISRDNNTISQSNTVSFNFLRNCARK